MTLPGCMLHDSANTPSMPEQCIVGLSSQGVMCRIEMEGQGLGEKGSKANAGSPSISRTSSGVFDFDREHLDVKVRAISNSDAK